MPRGRRHYRITPSLALSAHEVALQAGGRPGVRDWSQVLAAIGRPYSGYHRSIARKAAALLEAVACSHGFIDGNKRTAIILTELMLGFSGYVLGPADDSEDLEQALENFTVDVVAHRYEFDEMVAWFRARIRRLPEL